MKTKIGLNSRQVKLSAVAAATVLVAVGFAGCGGSDSVPVTSIPVTGAGNSPFVGVAMTATCANGATGTGTIGANVPGDGVINISGDCTTPILITATGKGKMRPLGAPANGSQDVDYDPTINLPISNILATPPAPGASVTANPVTTVVANAVVLAAKSGLGSVKPSDIVAAQGKAEQALGLDPGDASNVRSYLQPLVAEASTRIVEVAALAAAQASTTGVKPNGVTTAKPLGQVIAEQIAAAATAGTSMKDAAGVATAINAGTNAIDVTTNPAVAQVDNAAITVFNMVYTSIAGPSAPAKVSDLITSIAANNSLTNAVTTYLQGVRQAEAENISSKAVADAIAAPPVVPASGTSSPNTALEKAIAAVQQKLQTAATAVTTQTQRVSTTTTTSSTAAPTTTSTTTTSTTSTTVATNGCEVTVPSTVSTDPALIDVCYSNLTQGQCSATSIGVWDVEGGKSWGTKTAVTYSWVSLTGTTTKRCSNNFQAAQNFATATSLKTPAEASTTPPSPSALPVLVKN